MNRGAGIKIARPSPPSEKKTRGRILKSVKIGLGILVALFAARTYLTPESLSALLTEVQSLGHFAPAVLSFIYILACVLALPGSLLTLAAGFLFGLGIGYVSVAVGSVLGASAAFWIGRTVGREWVRRKVASNERFLAVDRAVARNGFKIVLLTRLSPAFPFNLQNFAYGATGVSFRDYFWGTLLGMAPGTILFVYFGSAMKNLAEGLSGPVQAGPAQQAMFGVGLIATIAVTLLVTRIARNALNETVEPASR